MDNSRRSVYDDCCLLCNIELNVQRSSYILEKRFKSNSSRTSFDFKALLPEQPSINAKITRSLLKSSARVTSNSIENEILSSESSEEENETISSPKVSFSLTDDYLNALKEWDPEKNQTTNQSDQEEEDDDDDNEIVNNNTDSELMDLSTELPSTQTDDILVTFVHYPVKKEPVIYDDLTLPQLDGQTDDMVDSNHKSRKQYRKKKTNLDEISPAANSNEQLRRKPRKANRPSRITTEDQFIDEDNKQLSKCTWEHMTIRKTKRSLDSFIDKKNVSMDITRFFPSINSSGENDVKKRIELPIESKPPLQIKRRLPSKKKNKFPYGHTGKLIRDYFKPIPRSSTNDTTQIQSPIEKIQTNPSNYFDGCLIIDSDDDDYNTEEINYSSYSISNNIHTRESHLDHAVHIPSMRIKWLLNLEYLLLEHIYICHEKHIEPLSNFEYNDNYAFYQLDTSFISIIILNFLKMFVIRNTNSTEEEFEFYQFSLTSYLRYLFLELPTYKHNEEYDCSICYKYNSILKILFDLLVDFVQYDICEIENPELFRSSLILDDYFNELKFNKKNPCYRIKLIMYFIELIQIHRNKCLNKKEFVFHLNEDRIFQSIEGFIQHIIYNLNYERISICFNVIELCLLFVNEKEYRIKQIALFLTKLCEETPILIHRCLFDKNLLPDIRLLLINELIHKKFNTKLTSIDHIHEFFRSVQIELTPPKPIDHVILLLIRSLFDTYADLVIDVRDAGLMSSRTFDEITTVLRNQLATTYQILLNLSSDTNSFQELKRTVIFFRLIICKWNRL